MKSTPLLSQANYVALNGDKCPFCASAEFQAQHGASPNWCSCGAEWFNTFALTGYQVVQSKATPIRQRDELASALRLLIPTLSEPQYTLAVDSLRKAGVDS